MNTSKKSVRLTTAQKCELLGAKDCVEGKSPTTKITSRDGTKTIQVKGTVDVVSDESFKALVLSQKSITVKQEGRGQTETGVKEKERSLPVRPEVITSLFWDEESQNGQQTEKKTRKNGQKNRLKTETASAELNGAAK